MWRYLLGLAAMLLPVAAAQAGSGTLAITGGTLIDVRNFGRSARDIPDAVVVVRDGKIVAAGPSSRVRVPRDAKRIDAGGRYIVPGLIDGFGTLRSQGFANAHLYHGVTTVYQPDITGRDQRRGKALLTARPSPRLFAGASITGYDVDPGYYRNLGELRRSGVRLTETQLKAAVHAAKTSGARAIWIGYPTWPDQVAIIAREARKVGLPTIGEFGFASYDDGLRAGVSTFVHTSRYFADFAPTAAREAYALAPFDRAAVQPVSDAQRLLDPASPRVEAYGKALAASRSSLLPTLALGVQGYTPWLAANPWDDPVAPMILPSELHLPVDPVTKMNERTRTQSEAERRLTAEWLANLHRLDARMKRGGARFLAGSGTSAFGVLPGVGLHMELKLLTDIGLTPREALAAATSNYGSIYGWRDVGLIEPGRFADILILATDPRRNVAALDDIATLLVGGEEIDRAALLRWRPPKE